MPQELYQTVCVSISQEKYVLFLCTTVVYRFKYAGRPLPLVFLPPHTINRLIVFSARAGPHRICFATVLLPGTVYFFKHKKQNKNKIVGGGGGSGPVSVPVRKIVTNDLEVFSEPPLGYSILDTNLDPCGSE